MNVCLILEADIHNIW